MDDYVDYYEPLTKAMRTSLNLCLETIVASPAGQVARADDPEQHAHETRMRDLHRLDRRVDEMNQEITKINEVTALMAPIKILIQEKAAIAETLSETTEKLHAIELLAEARLKDLTRLTTEKDNRLSEFQDGIRSLEDKLSAAKKAQKAIAKNFETAQVTVGLRDDRILELETNLKTANRKLQEHKTQLRKAAEINKEHKKTADVANKKAEKSANGIHELQSQLQDATNMCKKRGNALKTAQNQAKESSNTILELQKRLKDTEGLTSQEQETENHFEELFYTEKLKSIRARRDAAKYKADADRLPAATAEIQELIKCNNEHVDARRSLTKTVVEQNEMLAYFQTNG